MRRRDVVAIAALIAMVAPARADDPELDRHLAERAARLADHHYARGEYYRAITDYEELALFAPDDATRTRSLVRIATSYHRARQLGEAGAAYRTALGVVTDPALGQALRIQLATARAARTLDEPGTEALDAVIAELVPSTRLAPHRDYALFQLARIQALHGQRADARRTARELAALCVQPTPACKHEPILARSLARSGPHHRSRVLGVALSVIVPGAGSVYGGHLVDGLYYFALTSLPALGAWDVYDGARPWTDQKVTFYGLGAAAALFYVTNVFSAYLSVSRHNAIQDLEARRALWSATELPLAID
jgi:hypothetical protein